MVAPAPKARDPVAKAVTKVDDRGLVKEASNFADSTLARFFPLSQDDEVLNIMLF